MKKRILIVLVLLIASAGLLTRDVVAGPPWPSETYFMDDICVTPWLDQDYNFIGIWGDGIWRIHEVNNSVTLSCHDRVDFNEVATIEEVCTLMPGICDENGAADISGFACGIYYDYVTYDTHFVINPSGNWTLTCHFNENDLP